MSLAMSRANLSAIHTSQQAPATRSTSHSTHRSLPPLSALLNSGVASPSGIALPLPCSSMKRGSAPVSPTHGSTDLSQHQLSKSSSLNRTPIRLPSFDSLDFKTKTDASVAMPLLRHSKSLSAQSVPSLLPQVSPTLPTPTSQLKGPQKQRIIPEIAQESPLVEKRSYAFISHSPSTYPSQEPSIDNAQLARRKRRRTTPRELAILHEEFELGSTPNRARRIEIAKKTDMTEKAVQIWFQNRRQTLRRQSNAEREVHHLDPIFPHSSQGTPVHTIGEETPLRQQLTPFNPFHQTKSPPISSSPYEQDQRLAQHQPSSPTNVSHPPPFKNVLQTPSRASKPSAGSTLTFKLIKSPNGGDASTESALPCNKMISASPTKLSMTPVNIRQRQKAIMKVNPSPPRDFKDDLESNKENIPVGDLAVAKKEYSTQGAVERRPLGDLKSNISKGD